MNEALQSHLARLLSPVGPVGDEFQQALDVGGLATHFVLEQLSQAGMEDPGTWAGHRAFVLGYAMGVAYGMSEVLGPRDKWEFPGITTCTHVLSGASASEVHDEIVGFLRGGKSAYPDGLVLGKENGRALAKGPKPSGLKEFLSPKKPSDGRAYAIDMLNVHYHEHNIAAHFRDLPKSESASLYKSLLDELSKSEVKEVVFGTTRGQLMRTRLHLALAASYLCSALALIVAWLSYDRGAWYLVGLVLTAIGYLAANEVQIRTNVKLGAIFLDWSEHLEGKRSNPSS